MTIPDFTGVDLGASPPPSDEWGPGPEEWESPEGIPVKSLYKIGRAHV